MMDKVLWHLSCSLNLINYDFLLFQNLKTTILKVMVNDNTMKQGLEGVPGGIPMSDIASALDKQKTIRETHLDIPLGYV